MSFHDKSANILEVGCSSGSFLYFLKKNSFSRCCGVDIDKVAINFGIQNFQLNLKCNDFVSFSLSDSGEYDLIFAVDFFEHLEKSDLERAIAGFYRLLKVGGRVILRLPNPYCPLVLPMYYGDLTHASLITHELLCYLLRSAGFKSPMSLAETKPVNRWKKVPYNIIHYCIVKPLLSVLYIHFYGKSPKYLTRNIYVVAEK